MASEVETPDVSSEFGCRICGAQATGFHFEAQSCSACAAFFRRTVSLKKTFKCITNSHSCLIHYSLRQICRACRFRACLAAGMNKLAVQPRKPELERRRLFCTTSGLKRNKRFSLHFATLDNDRIRRTENLAVSEPSSVLAKQTELVPQAACSSATPSLPDLLATKWVQSVSGRDYSEGESKEAVFCSVLKSAPVSETVTPTKKANVEKATISVDQKYLFSKCDVLELLIREEMKVAERRRILFCERHVASLLGMTRTCPFTLEETRPLRFRTFRKQIRTVILLIYEWLRAWPDYETFSRDDQITFLRKCVLYHTILDSSFITMQIGYPHRFVMQNGGYVAVSEDSNEGWEDEKEISGETKKRIYRPLLRMLLSEVVEPMMSMKISFEEFVALKAFVSWHGTTCDISEPNRGAMRGMLNALCTSLHSHYLKNNVEVSERLGSIILLLSSVFATGLQFVESHHEVAFFDLWQLDSLLVQMLKMPLIVTTDKNARSPNDSLD